MSYFQNVFDQTYEAAWVLGDFKTHHLTYRVNANKNQGESMVAYNEGPYDFSDGGTFTINFTMDVNFKHWATFTVDVTGDDPAFTTAYEVRDILNAATSFTDWYTAGVDNNRVYIRQRKPKTTMRTYFSNSGAELSLKFNKYAGVADIPTYFNKDTIENRFNYEDSQGKLIRLTHVITANTVANPTVVTSASHGLTSGDTIYIVNSNSTPTIDGEREVTVTGANTFTIPVNVTTAGTRGEWLSAAEQQIVTDAGLNYTEMKEDWELLAGRTYAYTFTKNTVDGSSRITQQIIYPAGARVGTQVKKILYTYTAAQTQPDTVAEIPYTLASGDIITP